MARACLFFWPLSSSQGLPEQTACRTLFDCLTVFGPWPGVEYHHGTWVNSPAYINWWCKESHELSGCCCVTPCGGALVLVARGQRPTHAKTHDL